ncbi:MAG: hypothetical protein C4570_08800 [Ammonifex sp.]|nr:MAG: hypothetical protein C4570_08800 [Ammonifex sp.]
MDNISEMEKLQIRDKLSLEQVRAKKLMSYTDTMQDPALKGLLNQVQQISQQHSNVLNGLLGRAGVPQSPTHY